MKPQGILSSGNVTVLFLEFVSVVKGDQEKANRVGHRDMLIDTVVGNLCLVL